MPHWQTSRSRVRQTKSSRLNRVLRPPCAQSGSDGSDGLGGTSGQRCAIWSEKMDAASLALKALVDSGTDATIIPINFLQKIRARRSRKMWMRGTAGGRVLVDLYQISLQLGPFAQTLLEVVGSTQNEEVIVGRDVLNHLTVTLNGPANSVEVVEDIV